MNILLPAGQHRLTLVNSEFNRRDSGPSNHATVRRCAMLYVSPGFVTGRAAASAASRVGRVHEGSACAAGVYSTRSSM